MQQHPLLLPVKRMVDASPKENLTTRFISQLRDQLREAKNMEEFRTWVDDHYASYEASLKELQQPKAGSITGGMCADPLNTRESAAVPVLLDSVTGCVDEEDNCLSYGEEGNPFAASGSLVQLFNVKTLGGFGKSEQSLPESPTLEALPETTLQSDKFFHFPNQRGRSPCVEAKTDRDTASVLHLSSVWAPSVFQRGGDKSLDYGDSVTNSLRYRGCHNNTDNQSASILLDSMLSQSGVNIRSGAAAPARNGACILDVSTNGDFGEGMPMFSLDGLLPNQGPIFSRFSSRHSPVMRPIERVKAELASIDVPFLDDVDSSEMDSLIYRERYGVNVYTFTCINVLVRYNFSLRFGFDMKRLLRFYSTAVTYICSRNPFHNECHTADIVLTVHHFLQQPYVAENFSDEELFSLLFTSTIMKLGHIGMTNTVLEDVRHPYAYFHGFLSPQQGVSLSLALSLLETPECQFLTFASSQKTEHMRTPSVWTHAKQTEFNEMTAKLVMSTDERNHHVLLKGLQEVLREGGGNVVREQHLMIILQNVLHASDYCYLFRRPSVYKFAAACAVAEVYQQNQTLLWLSERGMSFWPRSEVVSSSPTKARKASNTYENIFSFSFSPSAHPPCHASSFHTIESGDTSVSEVSSIPSEAPNYGLTPSGDFMTPTLRSVVPEAMPTSAVAHHAKELQLAVLEAVFLPFVFTLSPFVPHCWLTNIQSNLVWLQEYPAEAFEADVIEMLRHPKLGGMRLSSTEDQGFERRVLRQITDSLFEQSV